MKDDVFECFFKRRGFIQLRQKKIRKNSGKKNGVCFLNESPSCFRTDLTDLRQEVAHLPNAGGTTVGIEKNGRIFCWGAGKPKIPNNS